MRRSHQEAVLDPGLPIVDAHHHLYDRPGHRYLAPELVQDLQQGHNIRATVFVQARSVLRPEGPEAMKHVAETEFADATARRCASGPARRFGVCTGIVGFADLTLGARVRPVLEAHIEAAGGTSGAGGRFCGVRHIAAWDAAASLLNPVYPTTEDMLASPGFREGFAQLARADLSFDAWLLFPQLARLTALARAFPDTRIVLNHCGGIVQIGRYASPKSEVFSQWSRSMRELATCDNVMVKLGGLGMRLSGFGFDAWECSPSSAELAQAWKPWIRQSIEAFGTSRCMFESNFPADNVSYDYAIGWNAMKRIVADATTQEKADLFWRNAARFYQLSVGG